MLLCLGLLLPGTGCSKTGKTPETLTREGWISDYANIIAPQDEARLSALLEAYEKETCHQVLVLTIPGLAGESMADFSYRTAMAWEIGQRGFGNGILLSIAMQEGNLRIETGSAFDWFVDQGVSDRVMKEVMVPYFRDEKYVDGIEQGLLEIMEAARLKVIPDDHRPDVCRR